MVDSLLRRAKAFIGLEEEEGGAEEPTQMDMTSFLKGSRKEVKEKDKEKEQTDYEVIIYDPKVYEDSLNISMYLRQGSPVIINLKHFELNLALDNLQ